MDEKKLQEIEEKLELREGEWPEWGVVYNIAKRLFVALKKERQNTLELIEQ